MFCFSWKFWVVKVGSFLVVKVGSFWVVKVGSFWVVRVGSLYTARQYPEGDNFSQSIPRIEMHHSAAKHWLHVM